MILHQSFREEMVEQLRELEDQAFTHVPKTVILSNNDMLDVLWYRYQKNIEDYGLEAREACLDALSGFHPVP